MEVARALLLGYALLVAAPSPSSLDVIIDHRPRTLLRVYAADNVLIGGFDEERRSFMSVTQMPGVMGHAVLAIEDGHFYEHDGVDPIGVLRADLANLHDGLSQSTPITMVQVACNFFLSSEKTYTHKVYRTLLSYKIETSPIKDQILELYMNQIYLGQCTYGFTSVKWIHFSKNIKDTTLAKTTMPAGLPEAPSVYNSVVNPKRAKVYQEYILQRMCDLHYTAPRQYTQVVNEQLLMRGGGHEFDTYAEYVVEVTRRLMYAQYREETYTRGLSVHTMLRKSDQGMVYRSVRRGILDYERRHGYCGPEAFADLPSNVEEHEQAIDDVLLEHPNNNDL